MLWLGLCFACLKALNNEVSQSLENLIKCKFFLKKSVTTFWNGLELI